MEVMRSPRGAEKDKRTPRRSVEAMRTPRGPERDTRTSMKYVEVMRTLRRSERDKRMPRRSVEARERQEDDKEVHGGHADTQGAEEGQAETQ